MATIQRSTTKVASKLLSYAEKRATEHSGIDCPPEYAKAQFKATRELWGKTEGIQAHHIIQSFKPGEVTPVLANEIGKELAKELAPGHEVVIYTHTDKDHIHNHIVINAVSFETGAKYHAHGTEELFKIREVSDRLCSEKGLSVIQEPSAEQRYHRAEYGLAKRGFSSWKDELRQSIDYLKKESNNINELADKLKKEKADKEAEEKKAAEEADLAVETEQDEANTTWDVTDVDALSNGNIVFAADLLLAGEKFPASAKVAAAKVLKAPWEYYGKLVTFTGIVATVTDFPPSDDDPLQSEVLIVTEDKTIVDFLCLVPSGNIQKDDVITISGLVTGRTEVDNKVGGTYTHLVAVTNKLPK